MLKLRAEEELGYLKIPSTRQVDAREEEGSDRSDGAQDGAQSHEDGFGEDAGRPEFGLESQTESGLKPQAEQQEAARVPPFTCATV